MRYSLCATNQSSLFVNRKRINVLQFANSTLSSSKNKFKCRIQRINLGYNGTRKCKNSENQRYQLIEYVLFCKKLQSVLLNNNNNHKPLLQCRNSTFQTHHHILPLNTTTNQKKGIIYNQSLYTHTICPREWGSPCIDRNNRDEFLA